MRFVPVRDLRIRPGRVFRQLRRARELVLTSRGRPIAIITAASEASLEDLLTSFRDARAAAAVRAVRARSRELGLHRLAGAEIDVEIRAARQARRAPNSR
jgi:antitoxin (DNA-binding transcriptional repressor) of toxin-antitoxin stability system